MAGGGGGLLVKLASGTVLTGRFISGSASEASIFLVSDSDCSAARRFCRTFLANRAAASSSIIINAAIAAISLSVNSSSSASFSAPVLSALAGPPPVGGGLIGPPTGGADGNVHGVSELLLYLPVAQVVQLTAPADASASVTDPGGHAEQFDCPAMPWY